MNAQDLNIAEGIKVIGKTIQDVQVDFDWQITIYFTDDTFLNLVITEYGERIDLDYIVLRKGG